MRTLEIAADVDLDGPGSSQTTAVNLDTNNLHPFCSGATAVVVMAISGWLEAEQDGAVMTLQGRQSDSDSWEDLTDKDGNTVQIGGSNQPMRMQEVVLEAQLRVDIESVTAGDGRGSVYLLGN